MLLTGILRLLRNVGILSWFMKNIAAVVVDITLDFPNMEHFILKKKTTINSDIFIYFFFFFKFFSTSNLEQKIFVSFSVLLTSSSIYEKIQTVLKPINAKCNQIGIWIHIMVTQIMNDVTNCNGPHKNEITQTNQSQSFGSLSFFLG